MQNESKGKSPRGASPHKQHGRCEKCPTKSRYLKFAKVAPFLTYAGATLPPNAQKKGNGPQKNKKSTNQETRAQNSPLPFPGACPMLEIARNAIYLANRPCFMWVKDTGRAAQRGGSLLILILYAVFSSEALSKKMRNAHFPQAFAVKFSSKDVNLGTKKEKAPCQSRGNVVQ